MSVVAVRVNQIRASYFAKTRCILGGLLQAGDTVVVLYSFSDSPMRCRLLELVDLHRWLKDNDIPYSHIDQEPEWEILEV